MSSGSKSGSGCDALAGLIILGLGLYVVSRVFSSESRSRSSSPIPVPEPPPPPSEPEESVTPSTWSTDSASDRSEADDVTICDSCGKPIKGEVYYYFGRPMCHYPCFDSWDSD